MIDKEIFTAIGMAFMAISYFVYIFSIFKGKTRPHPFSWFIWGLLTAIAFFAQISDDAGSAAYITGTSAFITILIAVIGYIKRHDIVITKTDKWAFILSLLAIPLWILTDTPLWSVILITLIDVAGFYPTYRKSWHRPDQEPVFSIVLTTFKHLFTVLALEKYSVITTLFPASLLLTNCIFLAILYFRGWTLKK